MKWQSFILVHYLYTRDLARDFLFYSFTFFFYFLFIYIYIYIGIDYKNKLEYNFKMLELIVNCVFYYIKLWVDSRHAFLVRFQFSSFGFWFFNSKDIEIVQLSMNLIRVRFGSLSWGCVYFLHQILAKIIIIIIKLRMCCLLPTFQV